MSQEPGLWSARRPRETLGGISLNSAIPQPSSAMKRSNSSNGNFSGSHVRSVSGSRHSLALGRPSQPIFSRSSSGGNLADLGMSSVKRASFQNNPGSALTSFGSGSLNSRNSENERRSSVHRARPSTNGPASHQSFFQQAPPAAGVPRDPRPLKDRTYQARIGQELLDYLSQHNFELRMKHTLSHKIIKSPTQKDFNYMFQFLYQCIDPSYRFQKNIDQEVPPILKQLRYPYEKSITKSQIAAVGGQNWSTFLGLLHWMMQLAQMLDGYASHRYDDACIENGIDVTGDHIIFDFLTTAYREWLAMDEDASDEDAQQALKPHIDAMARAFERSNSKYSAELEMLEGENARLMGEIDELEKWMTDPDIVQDQKNVNVLREALEGDIADFEKFIRKTQFIPEKREEKIQELQSELERLMEELKEADEERRALQKAVDDQGISMQDIDRMTSEHDRLQKDKNSAIQRLDEFKKRVIEKEMEASDRFDRLERLVDRYNNLAYQNALDPPSAANAKGQEYKLAITVNDLDFTESVMKDSYSGGTGAERLLADPVTGYQPAQILNLDLRGQVKNSLLALRMEISERRTKAKDAMMEDQDLLDGIKEAMEDRRNEVDALEHRVRAAEEEFEKTKEVTTTQRLASDAQIEKMEKELAKMRAQFSESVQLLEQREMNTEIEYERLTLRANALREELHTEVERLLNDVIKFKVHIQKNLEDYGELARDELEQELGGPMRDDTLDEEL
ncbi:HEC/Ndc80p family protein [Poronia punctata]|nr:HEC/Ndc80p family protein [Poronia punctata]